MTIILLYYISLSNKESMDILGISEENKDVEIIIIIEKEGMDYFFNRLGKINENEFQEEYYYFKQYFNMYLFNSEIWDINIIEQFEMLAKHKVNKSNICSIIDLISEENINNFWENLINFLNLKNMNEFLKETNSHKYYVNHTTWNSTKPQDTLLFNKLSNDIKNLDDLYEIIMTLLKNKETRKDVVDWISAFKNEDIHSEPVLSFENIIDVLQFSKVYERSKQEKYNKNTLVYFNMLKIFLKIFDNGIKIKNDVVKINKNYLDDENEDEKDYNFLTTLYFNLQDLIEKYYLFKYNELKKRQNYIEEMEYEIKVLDRMHGEDVNIINTNLKDSLILEKERVEFLKKEINFRKNPLIERFYYLSSYWININYEHIKTNTANYIISNLIQFFLEEKISEKEPAFEKNYYCNEDIFKMCLNILDNEKLSSDPSHKIDSVYIFVKNMQFPTSHNSDNFYSFYSQNRYEVFEANIKTCVFLKDKLDDYGESFKLYLYNKILALLNYANIEFNINTIQNKEIYEKFISIILEITNSSFEYWINNVKIIKKLQDEDKEKDLSSNDIEELQQRLETSSKYFINNLNYIYSISSSNFDIMTNNIIIKHFSNTLCYILDTLVGNHKNKLAIKDKENYGFYPLNFLKIISKIIQIFATTDIFINAIGKNCTYDSPNLFQNLIDILLKKGELYHIHGEILSHLNSKIIKIKELEAARDEIEIPDEFCDPIMQTLIETPVILPNTNIYMDREVICRHLLTEETNPFNREILNVKLLDEFNSQENIKTKLSVFKRKIEDWKKESNFI